MSIRYDEKTFQFTIRVNQQEYTLPPNIHPQFKMDTKGYFISYSDGTLQTIYVTDEEYIDIFDQYIE
jgi:hypothetical protein